METIKRNYKSDFDFIFDLGYYDERGEFVKTGWPPYDFELRFYTGQVLRNYVVKCMGGEATNCFNDNGEVHVVANNHGLGTGVLTVEGVIYLPNDIYPDGSQKIVKPQMLDIELVKGAGDESVGTFRARLVVPAIKGDPFRYEDFTAEQIAELQRPATEAAHRADEAAQRADKTMSEYAAYNDYVEQCKADAKNPDLYKSPDTEQP